MHTPVPLKYVLSNITSRAALGTFKFGVFDRKKCWWWCYMCAVVWVYIITGCMVAFFLACVCRDCKSLKICAIHSMVY